MNNETVSLDNLNILNSSFAKLSLKLREMGKEKEADQLDIKIQRMVIEIENVEKRALDGWSIESSKLIGDVNTCNGQVTVLINELNKKINIAENCIKAVSLIDQITVRLNNAV